MNKIITTIPKGRPDHPSLDFDLLRAEGIKHLETLATEVWTDFNAHDPGITMLELLCYAITDLGYRTRMIPVADLMAQKNPNHRTWFDVVEALPIAPVTELDFRKLLIDVKGVKNAWLQKAKPEEIVKKLFRTGWFFPNLMDEKRNWDKTKVERLLQTLILNYDTKNYPTYKKCLEGYLRSLERDPSLSVYQQLVQQINLEVTDRENRVTTKELSGLDALKLLELKKFFAGKNEVFNSDLEITAQNAEYYLRLYDKPSDDFPPFPEEWDGLAIKYQGYDQNAFNRGDFKALFRSFQDKALTNLLVSYKYTVVKIEPEEREEYEAFLKELLNLLETIGLNNEDLGPIKELAGTFFYQLENHDLYQNDGPFIQKINSYLQAKGKDELNVEQRGQISTYFDSLEKVITGQDYKRLIKYLDGKGDSTPIRVALDRLYHVYLPKDLGADTPAWKNIEQSEFEAVFAGINAIANKTSKSKKSEKSVSEDTIDYSEFIKIVTLDLPERNDIKRFAVELTTTYAPNNGGEIKPLLAQIALSKFLVEAFPIKADDPLIPLLLIELDRKDDDACTTLINHIQTNFCAYGINGITIDRLLAHEFYPDPIPLNGIYQIILDLDDDINTANPKQVEAVVSRAMRCLHANRAPCEDFLQPQIVEQRPVHFCVHLEVSPDMDERKVMAEVIWRFQEYLTPTLHFRSFKEMHDLGIPCDEIYNGPLLTHGFLLDSEVDAAQLVEAYYHSDLVRIAMNTPGVLGVRELKVKATPEGKVLGSDGLKLSDGPIYSVYPELMPGIFASPAPFLKRVIDLCESCFFVSKGALPAVQLNDKALQEQLDWLNLTRNCTLCAEPGGHLPSSGIYRPDLADYRSVQYDLPDVYTVGDNQVLNDAPPLRKAQARHLQAYLGFYDQILASYLAQLGQVNQLLSVDQDVYAPTRVLQALYEVPGVRELIEFQAIFTTTAEDWVIVLGDVPDSDRIAVRTALGNIATGNTQFEGFYTFRQQLESALDAAQYASYEALFSNYFWEKYILDETNNYRMALAAAAETPAHRQQHRDRLLNHLLARFGESFGTYVHALLLPDVEPEDNPWRQDFDDYLEDKARFLREVAALSHDRGRGYNYRKMLPMSHQPDVWNTDNVAGVKKRVSRLVGIDDYTQKSLIAEPPYRLDIVQKQNQQGNAQFRIVLKKRPEAVSTEDNPLETGPLMHSIRYSSKKKAQDKVTELYKNIWKTNYFKVQISDSDPDKWIVKFTLPDNELQSDALGEEEAKGLLALLQDLVKPGNGEVEGFHLVEHILLRPNDPKDQLLQIPLGCDPKETPFDPYSFWITVILPGWTSRFKHADFRYFFEQTFRSETPSHIAIRFCWVDLDTMYRFEDAFRKWLIEKAKCTPDECHVTDAANALIQLLNTMPCTCHCVHNLPEDLCNECGKPATHR